MEGMCMKKGVVIEINSTFGSFRLKTRDSFVYNKTEEKKRSFCNFIACDIITKLMRWWFIGNAGWVVSGSDISCNSAWD